MAETSQLNDGRWLTDVKTDVVMLFRRPVRAYFCEGIYDNNQNEFGACVRFL